MPPLESLGYPVIPVETLSTNPTIPARPSLPPHVSHSQLSTFSECQYRYKLKYVDEVEQAPLGALIGGKAIDQAIEYGEKVELWPEDVKDGLGDLISYYLGVLEHEIEEAGENIKWGGAWRVVYEGSGEMDADGNERMVPLQEPDPDRPGKMRNVKANENADWWRGIEPKGMLKRWIEVRRGLHDAGWISLGTQVNINFEISPGVLMKTYLDHLFENPDTGFLLVVDYKTGQVDKSDDRQLAEYALAVESSHGRIPDVAFCYLRDKSNPMHYVNVESLIPEMAPQFSAFAAQREVALDHGWVMNPRAWCGGCAVRSFCPIGRRVEEAA